MDEWPYDRGKKVGIIFLHVIEIGFVLIIRQLLLETKYSNKFLLKK